MAGMRVLGFELGHAIPGGMVVGCERRVGFGCRLGHGRIPYIRAILARIDAPGESKLLRSP